MDEIVLKKIRFTVRDLSLWESFLSDVLDLSVAPTGRGLEVKLGNMIFEMIQGSSSPIEWEFNWGPCERDVLLSRWSFYQYRGADSIRLKVVEDKLLFEIDAMSRIIVNFTPLHGREMSTLADSAVRIF